MQRFHSARHGGSSGFCGNTCKKQYFFSTPLEWDIRVIYPKEYAFALKAVRLIEDFYKVRIPDEEAPFWLYTLSIPRQRNPEANGI